MKVSDIYGAIDSLAPFSTQLSFDNAGLLVGNGEAEVSEIILCLDITRPVVAEAVRRGAELVISHHPVIFHGIKNIDFSSPVSDLLKNNICAICAHTNLDAAAGGVNDALCDILGIKNASPVGEVGRIGDIEKTDLHSFALHIKKSLSAPSVVFADGNSVVSRVCVVGGSGGEEIEAGVKAGADTVLTGEVRHHEYLEAKRCGYNLIAAGHFATENVVLPYLKKYLSEKFPSIETEIAVSNTDPTETV